MFGEDHEKGGHDHHDGAEIKAGRIKSGEGKPFFRGHIGEIDNAHDDGKDISAMTPIRIGMMEINPRLPARWREW